MDVGVDDLCDVFDVVDVLELTNVFISVKNSEELERVGDMIRKFAIGESGDNGRGESVLSESGDCIFDGFHDGDGVEEHTTGNSHPPFFLELQKKNRAPLV